MVYTLDSLIRFTLPDLLIPRTHTFSTDSGFTHLYLLHSFQGLKRLTLFIIETYTLAYQLFLISYIFYRLCGFTNRYLIHLFQGLKCLTLPIIETYSPWTYTCISICHFC
jgi:hypothetical protein